MVAGKLLRKSMVMLLVFIMLLSTIPVVTFAENDSALEPSPETEEVPFTENYSAFEPSPETEEVTDEPLSMSESRDSCAPCAPDCNCVLCSPNNVLQELALMGGSLDVDYTYIDGVLTIINDGTYTIGMIGGFSTTSHCIVVESGVNAEISLNNVNIDVSDLFETPAFDITGATVVLTLNGNNKLRGGYNRAGLQVPLGATLTITGSGRLFATGGYNGAGIGSSHFVDSDYRIQVGNITITDGIVTAQGGEFGAGIGFGSIYHDDSFTHGGKITITGGSVTANGGLFGAGIGGSSYNSSVVTITGGTVTAQGGEFGAGIGGGQFGHGGLISISGSAKVTATGGDFGAGIGGGVHGRGGEININGGTVTAYGGHFAAGIGGGEWGAAGNITITGGTVIAMGDDGGAGIGGGWHNNCGSEITITGGSIKAEGGNEDAAAIGRGQDGEVANVSVEGYWKYWVNETNTVYGATMGSGLFTSSDTYSHITLIELTQITLISLTANGASGTADTTELTLTFSDDPKGLTIADITLTGAVKGSLTGSGTTRILTISNITVENGEKISVHISNPEGSYITPNIMEVEIYKTINQGGNNSGNTVPTIPDDVIPNNSNSPPRRIIPFIDVFESDWFVDAVMYAYERGLMIGTSTEPMMFSPNMELTRGMAATVPYRHAGSPDVIGLINPFTDVPANKWFTDAVVWAADKGIVLGLGDGRFAPCNIVTRQDLAAILNRYVVFTGIELPVIRDYTGFNDDADIANYAKEAVEKFFCAGIISGKPGNIFDPQGQTTRAEFATIIMNFLEVIE